MEAQYLIKKNRQQGLPYTGITGKEVQQKQPKVIDCSKCRFRCSQNVSIEEWEECCQYYYSLDVNRKRDFIISVVKTASTDRRRRGTGKRPKQISCSYYLRNAVGDVRVCQKFFCMTLAISKKTVQYALKNRNSLGHFELPNVEGSRKAVNKTSDERESLVREHIESFPQMESHYCRANTVATYLSPELNISEMHRLYLHDFCVQRNITDPVTKGIYRRIFVSDFNIRFFVPKKTNAHYVMATMRPMFIM